jgi:hypothetical protein
MLDWLLAGAALLYGGALARSKRGGRLADSLYASPAQADALLDELAQAHPERARVERYGHSSDGRPLRALRIGADAAPARLLVSGQIHAGEFVAGYVAREVARSLLERAASDDPAIEQLLSRAQVIVAPLLNPDGAERVWRRHGWVRPGVMRHTSNGVDPNRNFPFESAPGRRAWNSGRRRRGAAYYRGPYPLSEPECAGLARLAERERFCAAINFHSFGAVVFRPALEGLYAAGAGDPVARGLAVFDGPFQSRQRHAQYRTVSERPAAIGGQLDAYLLGAFGTASVTVEVGRPGLGALKPSRVLNPFWLANPESPAHWADNDVAATLHALCALLDATGGRPGRPRQPSLASW